jgi:membrane-bound inhibitor of C-type lysozyme
MHRLLRSVLLAALVSLMVVPAALADTRAPSTETFTFACDDGTTVTVVVPVEDSAAAQVVNSTDVVVLQRLSHSAFGVLYEAPSYQALSQRRSLTTCTSEELTFVLLRTPQRG